MDSIEIIVTNSDSTSSIPTTTTTTTHYQMAPNSVVTNTTKSDLNFKFNAEKINGSKSKVNHLDGRRHGDVKFDESKKPLLSLQTSTSSYSLNSPKKVKVLATSSSSQLPLPSHSTGIYDPML